MALTVTNTNTLRLLNILNSTASAQSNALTRLSTGSRINRGADDPAGLIASRGIDTELTSVNAALSNNQRTDAILNVADSAIGQISGLLDEVSKLAQASANSAGLSADELAANQSQIDNILQSVDRIVGTTEFNGKKLLDGSQRVNSSGVDNSEISDVRIFSRDSSSSSTTVTVDVTTAATQASLASYATTSAASDTSISVQGKLGSAVIEITAGENLSSVAAKINAATAQTGVTASATAASLSLNSQTYGTSAFVRVSVISGDTTNYTNNNDSGSNAVATVNGQQAAVDGLNVNYSANGLSLTFNLTETFNQATGSSSFTVSDGGATFQLGTDASTRATIGIDSLYTQQLGSASLGYLSSLKSGGANSLLSNPSQAATIAAEASAQIAKSQGRVGGFQKFQVQSALKTLEASKEGLATARSVIADTDFAAESAELNRQNVLLQSALGLLGLANQQSSQVLSLLR
ncbi:B-type flagellin [Phycisphaerae bacterium RAS1]|nr:B-type flagellin [Phycisphaerae bacterium RAS1]